MSEGLSFLKVRKIRGFVCGRTILHSWIGLGVKPPSGLPTPFYSGFPSCFCACCGTSPPAPSSGMDELDRQIQAVEARIARLRLLPQGDFPTSSSEEEGPARPALPPGDFPTSSSEEEVEQKPLPKPAIRSPVWVHGHREGAADQTVGECQRRNSI
eukprot:COSAG05_NODE_664_length_8020_cov_31.425578_2_plen_156_part_00